MATIMPITDKGRFVMITPQFVNSTRSLKNARQFLPDHASLLVTFLIKKIRTERTLIQISLRLLRSIHDCFRDYVTIKSRHPCVRSEGSGFYHAWLSSRASEKRGVRGYPPDNGVFIQLGRLYSVFARRTFVSRLAASRLLSVVATLVHDSFPLDMDHYWPPKKNADCFKRNPAQNPSYEPARDMQGAAIYRLRDFDRGHAPLHVR